MSREIALRALDRRAYGRTELGRYLARKGATDEVIDRLLDRFEQVGLLDDEAFASQLVDARHRGRQLPRRALIAELRRKGLNEEVIADAVAPIDQEAEQRAALELARRKARSLSGLDYDVALRRLVGVLGRRGFSGELAWKTAKTVLNESDWPKRAESGQA